jgi:ABC-type antimicrobial peptide transport system permease subunit
VVQRTKEMGIRRALGARHADILRWVMLEGLCLTLAGAAVGVGSALTLTQLLQSLIFGVTATDPTIFSGITVLLIVVALSAGYIPAWRSRGSTQWRHCGWIESAPKSPLSLQP